MTRISPSRRPKRWSARTLFLLFLLVVVLAAAALWREGLANVLWRAATPVLEARALPAGLFSAVAAQMSSKVSLEEQNEALRAALASSSAALLDRNVLLLENRALKQQLGRSPAPTRRILAAVVLAPPGVPYDTLFIDAGSAEGVSEGAAVFAGGSVAVGHVSQVYPHAARVVLLSSPGEEHDALLETQDGDIPLTVTGSGGGSLSGEVPAGTAVAVGDVVLLRGIEPTLAASVVQVTPTESGSFLTLHFSLPVNPFTLRYVEVSPQTTL